MDSVDYYNRYASIYFDNTSHLDMGETLERFMKLMETKHTVLDLGCGSGRDGKIMMERGLEVTFLDASEEMCELADIYTGVEPLCMDFRDMDFTNVFDGIWACASLLHATKEELPGILNRIYDALKSDGVFYMSVKKGSYEGFRHERYFADYTMTEIRDIIRKIPGFQVIDLWETRDVRTSRDDKEWVNVLVRKTV